MSQLAARSALRFFRYAQKLGLACGHCYLSLSLRRLCRLSTAIGPKKAEPAQSRLDFT